MPEPSAAAKELLELLRDRHNVLVSGPPGTGKSRLLAEVARAFSPIAPGGPVHVPGARVAIPTTPPIDATVLQLLPSPSRANRRVFRTVFHQNSKHREFVSGLVPGVASAIDNGQPYFKVSAGTLLRASDHALLPDGASLLIIDEINRGPAVQIFGGSIVAIESDKRRAEDGTPRAETQFFELMDPVSGDLVEYALPHHLYILAAMNQADTSVEPLDVAFLRRWTPYRLNPDRQVLRAHFNLSGSPVRPLPDLAATPSDVYEAAEQAWAAVNSRIRLGRSPEFQIGHGVLMARKPLATSLEGALLDVTESWRQVRAHVDEVFFGDVRGVAVVLNVGTAGHPYTLVNTSFGDDPRLELTGPDLVESTEIYRVLRAVAG